MRHLLKLHSRSSCLAEIQVAVEAIRPFPQILTLSYVVTGNIGKLRIPPTATPSRSDELWRHTCFEAFIRTSDAGYYEFNFAPTAQWAAYHFAGYRSEQCPARIRAPDITVQSDADRYRLDASLQLDSLSLLSDESWHLGLSAVIEETSGGLSHWALAHPPGPPDFHHADSFVYELLPTVQA
jgi:hypothetical protein